MPDILIRGLDAEMVQKLKARARSHGRSLQSEAKLILEQAAGSSLVEALAAAKQWRQKLKGPGAGLSDSAEMIREDRRR